MTKHLRFLIVLLMTLVWSAGWAAESVYKTLSFPDDDNANNKISSYTSKWIAKIGSDSWSIVNFNNNNWKDSWKYIKCGREKQASVATISNSNAFDKPITKVVVNASKITDLTKVKSIKLETSKVADFSSIAETVTLTSIAVGYLKFDITNPIENGFYRLTFDCLSKKNGLVQVDQVDYYIDDSKTPTTISLGDCDNMTFSFTNGKPDDTFTTPTATVTPEAATGAVQYTSSNKDIVTVATNGELSFTNTTFGSATISAQFIATGDYANSNTVTYTVVNKEPQKTATEVTFGDKSQQTITLTDGDVTGVVFPKASEKNNIAGTISYESSNTDVAVVDAEGNVTVKGAYGEATITATFTPTEAETYAASTDWYKVVNKVNAAFYESFDKCDGKGGNDGTFSALSGSTDLSSTYTDNEGWNSIKGYVASKCVRFGTRDDKGSATTPSITVTGKGVLSFMAAAWKGDAPTITVSVSDGATLTYNGKTSSFISVNINRESWTNIDNIEISGAKTFTITFAANVQNNRFFLDEVMVKDIPTVTLDETATNNNIEAKSGVNVTLKRTMKADMWNTICLPFDVTYDDAKAAFGNDVKIAELDGNSTGTTLSFKNVDAIKATIPYLIKPSEVKTSNEYVFENVNIDAANVSPYFDSTKSDFAFVGIYNMVDITNDVVTTFDNTYYAAFLGSNNIVHKATTGTTKGFRAYFAIPNGTSASALRVVIDGTATSIKNIDSEVVESNAPVYNLQGQRVDGNNLTPGIYVKAGKKFVVK